ncbi:MAG: hypothetical protein Q9M40_01990 [Sulfurimonas sp.]|nr:hypothetical protein [Sulfurimonas sp.]
MFLEKIKKISKDRLNYSYKIIKEKIPLDKELDEFLQVLSEVGVSSMSILTTVQTEKIDQTFIKVLSNMNKSLSNEFNILDIFHFNWKPDLSTGQEAYLFQFANFDNIIKNSKNNIVILLDEGETTMHPNWQKKYINYYVEFLKNNFKDKKFHIVLTSHSPFILSDLPKENIIFLKKDKETAKCLNVTATTELDTFGANIHTLLSHGFFMNDGLMGEFSKGKIDDLINYLNDKQSDIKNNDEAQKLLNIIGEPIIKNQLQRMLDGKRLRKVDEIDKLSDEIELMKHRIEF